MKILTLYVPQLSQDPLIPQVNLILKYHINHKSQHPRPYHFWILEEKIEIEKVVFLPYNVLGFVELDAAVAWLQTDRQLELRIKSY